MTTSLFDFFKPSIFSLTECSRFLIYSLVCYRVLSSRLFNLSLFVSAFYISFFRETALANFSCWFSYTLTLAWTSDPLINLLSSVAMLRLETVLKRIVKSIFLLSSNFFFKLRLSSLFYMIFSAFYLVSSILCRARCSSYSKIFSLVCIYILSFSSFMRDERS